VIIVRACLLDRVLNRSLGLLQLKTHTAIRIERVARILSAFAVNQLAVGQALKLFGVLHEMHESLCIFEYDHLHDIWIEQRQSRTRPGSGRLLQGKLAASGNGWKLRALRLSHKLLVWFMSALAQQLTAEPSGPGHYRQQHDCADAKCRPR
jgi:hypothetical protein